MGEDYKARIEVVLNNEDHADMCLNGETTTLKIRSGCDGGGKGPLVQEELSATLATHQDQTLFELRNTVLND